MLHRTRHLLIRQQTSVINAIRAHLAGSGEGTFTEGHELDANTEKRVPKAMVGRQLSQQEAQKLLAELEWGPHPHEFSRCDKLARNSRRPPGEHPGFRGFSLSDAG